MALMGILNRIKPLDKKALENAKQYCDNLAKPLGALGKLEEMYCRLSAITKGQLAIAKKVVIVYVADNGICQEGISSNPQATTYQVGQNMLNGQAGINIMTQQVGADVTVVDIGCLQNLSTSTLQKVMFGTCNALKEPAMTREQAEKAILVGYQHTEKLIAYGYDVFGAGEMGVGNTTTSVAVISQLLGVSGKTVVGFGAGISDKMLLHKANIIDAMVKKHEPYTDAIDVASKIGGLDILGMVGTYLACAVHSKPFVIDGVIAISALLVASHLNSDVLEYAFTSHGSTEPGYQAVSSALNLAPMFQLDMRLGEGTGCPLTFFLMDMAVKTMQTMPSFQEANLKKTDYVDIRQKL